MLTSFILKTLNREAASPKSKPDEIIENLGIREGWTIADLGSGGGYFTLRLATKVGKTGKVYAIDTKPKYLEFVKHQADLKGLSNVALVSATNDRPDLPEAGLNLIFARNVFHHLPHQAKYFASLKKYLKPDGRIAIIEHRPKKGLTFASIFGHNTPAEAIQQTLEAAGYTLTQSYDFLTGQSFSVFKIRTTP